MEAGSCVCSRSIEGTWGTFVVSSTERPLWTVCWVLPCLDFSQRKEKRLHLIDAWVPVTRLTLQRGFCIWGYFFYKKRNVIIRGVGSISGVSLHFLIVNVQAIERYFS